MVRSSEVRHGRFDPLKGVPEHPDCGVAVLAQKTANFARQMAVVDREGMRGALAVSSPLRLATDAADAPLLVKDAAVVLLGQTVGAKAAGGIVRTCVSLPFVGTVRRVESLHATPMHRAKSLGGCHSFAAWFGARLSARRAIVDGRVPMPQDPTAMHLAHPPGLSASVTSFDTAWQNGTRHKLGRAVASESLQVHPTEATPAVGAVTSGDGASRRVGHVAPPPRWGQVRGCSNSARTTHSRGSGA